MTLKRRITALLIGGLVIAAVVGVYYMPQWQQTAAAVSKGGRRGAPAASDPIPVLVTAGAQKEARAYLRDTERLTHRGGRDAPGTALPQRHRSQPTRYAN
jgi:hypothetical protein